MAGDGRNVRRKGIAAVGVIAALLSVLVAVGLLGRGGGGTAQAAGEIYLAPASSTGPNPFTASLMTQAATTLPTTPPPSESTPPTAPRAAAPPQAGAATAPPTAASTAAGAAPATALTSVDASVPQLYGGRMGVSPCDAGLLRRRLDADGDVSRAWSVAEGIDIDAVHDFVGELVPVDLLDDVQVTDWRRVDGRGVAFQVVLERGTTVLVDHFGLPRVRCLSGDPLTLPDKVQRSARFVGERWDRFQPTTVIVIVPASKVLPTLVLLETSSGQPFGRPVGGGRADIDSQTLIATQAQLGVVVNERQQASPDQLQDVRLSPWGGPPGSSVLAFGTGWPAGDRIRLEPCVGSRPETCSLRTDAVVFAVVDPDGGFRSVVLRVPGDVSLGDYVEFYVQDLRDDHRQRSFDTPWTVAAAECRDDCGGGSGCHPPFCGGGGGDQHGCRCMVRTDPVCEFDSCDSCPKDRCAERLREEPTPTPRPASSHTGQQSQALQSTHGATAQQFAGQGSHTSTTTTSASTGTQPGQGTSTSTHSQTTQTTQTTHAQTGTTQSSSRATPTPAPKPTPTPTPAPPKPTPTPTSAPPPPPKPTPAPTPAPKPTATPAPKPTPTPAAKQTPPPTAPPRGGPPPSGHPTPGP